MNITLYYNSSEKNKIGKSLNNAQKLSGTLKEESGIVNPTITIKHSNPVNYNYIYIDEFKRYYFIDEITSVRNGIWSLNLSVDVLESFKSYFMGINCIIDKVEEEEKSNPMFDDGTFMNTEKTFNEIITFPNRIGDGDPMYLLTVF